MTDPDDTHDDDPAPVLVPTAFDVFGRPVDWVEVSDAEAIDGWDPRQWGDRS